MIRSHHAHLGVVFLLILLVEYPVPVVLGLVVALWLFEKKLMRDLVWIKTVFDLFDEVERLRTELRFCGTTEKANAPQACAVWSRT
jgi:hypothetical protein